jgi:hypothetical protein
MGKRAAFAGNDIMPVTERLPVTAWWNSCDIRAEFCRVAELQVGTDRFLGSVNSGVRRIP